MIPFRDSYSSLLCHLQRSKVLNGTFVLHMISSTPIFGLGFNDICYRAYNKLGLILLFAYLVYVFDF